MALGWGGITLQNYSADWEWKYYRVELVHGAPVGGDNGRASNTQSLGMGSSVAYSPDGNTLA